MPYAAGTCRDCGAPADASRCDSCAAARREAAAAERDRKRKAGLCLYTGCTRDAAKSKIEAGSKRVRKQARYCTEHLAYYAARQRG